MTPSLSDCLYTIVTVFEGRLSRRELARRPTIEQVSVAHAIMLALPERFLADGYQLRGSYIGTLYDLVGRGLVNVYEAGRYDPSPEALARAGRRHGLYASSPHGRNQRVTLTPSPELVKLVQELGHPPALYTFLEDAAAGFAQDQVWAAVYQAQFAAKIQVRLQIDP